MDKGLTVPKWMQMVWLKTPQMSQNLSAQFVCPSPKVWDFNEKMLHWASVVRVWVHTKGQLISKCPFGVIVWTKIPRKNFRDFCPSL